MRSGGGGVGTGQGADQVFFMPGQPRKVSTLSGTGGNATVTKQRPLNSETRGSAPLGKLGHFLGTRC